MKLSPLFGSLPVRKHAVLELKLLVVGVKEAGAVECVTLLTL